MLPAEQYGEVLPHVDSVPRTVTQIYSRWTGLPEGISLTRRRRRERRSLATYLEIMSKRGVIHRGVQQEGRVRWVGFWRDVPAPVEAHGAEGH